MSKLVAIAILLVSSISVFGQESATVESKAANLRSEPDIKGKVLRAVKQGEELELIEPETFRGWYYVIHKGQRGWIHKSVVRPIAKVPPIPRDRAFTLGAENYTSETGGSGYTDDAPPPPVVPKRISGGVVNGKAVSLPTPSYPAAARAVNAKGSVSVAIVISKYGKVISASAVSGHQLLRTSAVEAARKATFRPTLLQGEPVEVSGILVYNFQ